MFLGEGGSFLNSPRFQGEVDLNKSELSCLPESRSPVKPLRPTPIECRLLLKAQATERRIAQLRLQREQAEAASYRDRPMISVKSKQLAAQAEVRFWQQHSVLSIKERIQEALKQPVRSAPSKQPPRPRHLRANSDTGPRSISPVPVQVSYRAGCNFGRLIRR